MSFVIVLKKNSQYVNPLDAHRCAAHTKPCLENNIIWTSNLGLRKLNDDRLFVVDSFTKSLDRCTDAQENLEIRMFDSNNSKKMYRNDEQTSLERSQVKSYKSITYKIVKTKYAYVL